MRIKILAATPDSVKLMNKKIYIWSAILYCILFPNMLNVHVKVYLITVLKIEFIHNRMYTIII